MKRYNMRDVTPYVTVHPDGEWVRYEDHVAALAQQPQGEINQCDGCMSGAELREGRHHSADGRAFMLCQAERYAAPPQAAPVAQGLMLTGDQIRAAVRDARMTCGPSDAPQPADYVQAGARAILAQAAPSASAQQAEPVKPIVWQETDEFGEPQWSESSFGQCRDDFDYAIPLYAAPAPSASPAALTDGEIREVVSELCSIARNYFDKQQLRARIAGIIVPRLKPLAASPADQGEDARDVAPESSISRLLWDAAKAIQWHLEPDSPDEHESLMKRLYEAAQGIGMPSSEVTKKNDDLPFVSLSAELLKALKRLSFTAQTTGGVAGHDDKLVAAISEAESAIQFASGRVAAKHISDGRANRLEQDAKRYRWIRRDRTSREDRVIIDILVDTCEEYFDAAIDAAMSASKEGA